MATNLKIQTFRTCANTGIARLVDRLAGKMVMAMPAVFLTGTLFLESRQTGYNRVSNTISELVLGSGGWIQTALFCLIGLALWVLAFKLVRVAGRDRVTWAAAGALTIAGTGFMVVAVFPTCPAGEPLSVTGLIHKYAAVLISGVSPLISLFVLRFFKTNRISELAFSICLISGLLGLALNTVGLVVVAGDMSWIGALERAILVNGLLALQIIAWVVVSRRPENKPEHARDRETWVLFPAFSRTPVHARQLASNTVHLRRRIRLRNI